MNRLRVALDESQAEAKRDGGVLELSPPESAGTSSKRLSEDGRA